MSEDKRRLIQAARQLIEADAMLSGGGLAPGAPLPAAAARPAATPPSAPASAPPRAPAPAGRSAGAAAAFSAGNIPPPDRARWADDPEAVRRQTELEKVAAEVRVCPLCRLCQGRTHAAPGEGSPTAQVMFIGEGPGEEEDRQGRPFVGRAGELLTRQIQAMGLTRSDVFIANVVKCRPPGNRAPMADEVAACADYLRRQMLTIRPKVLVALGNPATHALLQTTEGITRLRGRWQQFPTLDPELSGIKVMPTFHPAFLLRQYTEDNRQKVWLDLQEVMKALGLPPPKKR